jgi:hypothetical protein
LIEEPTVESAILEVSNYLKLNLNNVVPAICSWSGLSPNQIFMSPGKERGHMYSLVDGLILFMRTENLKDIPDTVNLGLIIDSVIKSPIFNL